VIHTAHCANDRPKYSPFDAPVRNRRKSAFMRYKVGPCDLIRPLPITRIPALVSGGVRSTPLWPKAGCQSEQVRCSVHASGRSASTVRTSGTHRLASVECPAESGAKKASFEGHGRACALIGALGKTFDISDLASLDQRAIHARSVLISDGRVLVWRPTNPAVPSFHA
jgi:hypothetical protein